MNHCDDQVQHWADQIRNAYQANNIGLAASLASQGIAETKSAPEILEMAGMIAYERGEWKDCICLIGNAMLELSLSLASQLTLAKAWLKTGNKSQAETTLAFLVEMINRLPCSMLPNLTHAAAEAKRFDLAFSVCRVAFDRHPEDDNAVFGAAFYMYRLGYPLELVKSLMLKAVDLKPDSQLYRVNIATVCCETGEWNEAYAHASLLSDRAIQNLPCGCIAEKLRNLFVRFGDDDRLELMQIS